MNIQNPLNRRHLMVISAALAMSGMAHAAGVSDKEILIGTHLDLSGPTATGARVTSPPHSDRMRLVASGSTTWSASDQRASKGWVAAA